MEEKRWMEWDLRSERLEKLGKRKRTVAAAALEASCSESDLRGRGVGAAAAFRSTSRRWPSGPRCTCSCWPPPARRDGSSDTLATLASDPWIHCITRYRRSSLRTEMSTLERVEGGYLTGVEWRLAAARLREEVGVELAVRLARHDVRHGHHRAGRQLQHAVHLAVHDAQRSFRHQTRALALLARVPGRQKRHLSSKVSQKSPASQAVQGHDPTAERTESPWPPFGSWPTS